MIREGGISEPTDPRPVSELRAQLLGLLEVSNQDGSRDIELISTDAKKYDALSVGIDVDLDNDNLRCVVARPTDGTDVFASQDWYVITPTGQLLYEPLEVVFSYAERTKLAAYDEAILLWRQVVKKLNNESKLEEIDEYLAIDRLTSNYVTMRSNFFQQSEHIRKSRSDIKGIGALDFQRQQDLIAAEVEQQKALDKHLADVYEQVGETDFLAYKPKFEAIMNTFISRCNALDDVSYRLAEASKEANERLELERSDPATLEQAWQLLALLDKCQDYMVE